MTPKKLPLPVLAARTTIGSHATLNRRMTTDRHSLAEEFDGVTTRTEGEVDDRHVVLYKLGYEPPEEEAQVDRQVGNTAAVGANSRAPVTDGRPAAWSFRTLQDDAFRLLVWSCRVPLDSAAVVVVCGVL